MLKTNIVPRKFFRAGNIFSFRNRLNLIHPVDGLLRHLCKDTEYTHRFGAGKKTERGKHQ